MCFFFSGEKPEKVSTKGSKAGIYNQMIGYDSNPNTFEVAMKDACCKEPLCCCASSFCAPCGITACWARNTALKHLHPGEGHMDNYLCCQGYIGTICCCIHPREYCEGSCAGLLCEGCCCPILSLSIARIHLMDKLQLKPDPCDYQLIACSNCLQCLSCILHIVAAIAQIDAVDKAADIVECIADVFTYSVAGCMGAQVKAQCAVTAGKQTNAPGDVNMTRH